VSAALIRDILHRYVRGGGTVVFSSHVMEVVEKPTHVAIMNDGTIRRFGTLERCGPAGIWRGVRGGRRWADRDRPGASRGVTAAPPGSPGS